MDRFSGDLAQSLPFNTAMGLNWSDAYIGQLLDKPPRFGLGFSLGYTTIQGNSLNGLMQQFGASLPLNVGGFPLPGYTVEGRIGGIVLPFDVGFKVGYLNLPLAEQEADLDYFLIGFDVRYVVLKGGKLPTISVGAGFNYLSGGVSAKVGDEVQIAYPTSSSTTGTLTMDKPTVGMNWETKVFDLKAQISKSFLIFTPYFGVGTSVGWSQAGYGVKTKITDSENNLDAAKDILAGYGIHNLDETGFSSTRQFARWNFRTFGGFSINIAFLRLDLTAMYNFVGRNYGVTFGTRIQL
jgi:hypothetical protein